MSDFENKGADAAKMVTDVARDFDKAELIASIIFLIPVVLLCTFIFGAPFIPTYITTVIAVFALLIYRKLRELK